MEIDHIIPVSLGGQTVLDNLCLACPTCNTHKSDHQTGYDPETHNESRLFKPRIDTWGEHFSWSLDGVYVMGRTPVGRATVERLHMNEPAVVEARRRWTEVGWHPPE